ncbi:MAG: MFS transporter [Candidatus Gracilibacteria bacterium]|nr:MFS transporter [Candidatus Gracilibacteria bacterium]
MKKLRTSTKILLITNALVLVSGAMIGPIYALFVKDIGGDLMDASFAGGLFALTAGIITFFSGKYTDALKNQSLVLFFGYITIGIGFFLYLIVDSILMLFAVQIIIGIGEAIYSPAFDALYSKHLHKKQSGYEWGIWESVNYFTIAIGAFVGGIVVNYFGFQVIFILMGALSIISGCYVYISSKKLAQKKVG